MADNKPELFRYLVDRVREVAEGLDDRDRKLERITGVLADGWPAFSWVGLYWVDAERRELVLGPFSGAPTDHVRIPFGRGVCGQVAESGEARIVDDVTAEANYLACSPHVRSEIVVPLEKDGRIVAQLDIDSNEPSAFGDEEQEFVNAVARIVEEIL
jgi:GAF domain-containing protein